MRFLANLDFKRSSDLIVHLVFIGTFLIMFGDVIFFDKLIAVPDAGIPVHEPLTVHLGGFYSSWSPHSLGVPNPYPGWPGALIALFVFISGGNQVIAQKFMLSHILVACFTMYFFLTNHLTRSRLFGSVGALLYAYSPFVLDNFGTRMIWGYAFLPLVLNYVFNIFNEERTRIRDPLLLSLSITLTFAFYRDVIVPLPFIILVFFLVNLAYKKFSRHYFFHNLKYYGISLMVFLVVSFGWFAWLYYSGSTELVFNPPTMETFFRRYSAITISNMLRITGMGPQPTHPIHSLYLENNPIGFVLPMLAFSAAFVVEKNKKIFKEIIGFLVTIFIFVIFVMSVQGKWIIFTWLYYYYPLLPSITSPHAIFALMCIVYASLITTTLDGLHRLLERSTKRISSLRKHIKSISLMLIVLIPFFLYCPVYSSTLRRLTPSFPNPPAYGEAVDWMRSRGEDGTFRYLLAPTSYIASQNLVEDYPYTFSTLGAAFLPIAYDYTIFINDVLAQNKTDNLGSLIAPANVKYAIVITNTTEYAWSEWQITGPVRHVPPFLVGAPENFVDVISHQKELTLVEMTNDFIVYENTRFIPHIAVFPAATYVVGDRDALVTVSSLPGYNVRDGLVIFGEQYTQQTRSMLESSSVIIFDDRNFHDLLMSLLVQSYGVDLWNFRVGIEETELGKDESLFTYGDGYVEVRSDVSLNIEFHTGGQDTYVIWLRVLFSPSSQGTLTFLLDGEPLGTTIEACTNESVGFKWVKLGTSSLQEGNHTLTVNGEGGPNALDEIIVAPSHVVEEVEKDTLDSLNGKEIVFIYDGGGSSVKQEGDREEYEFSFQIPKKDHYSVALRTTPDFDIELIKVTIDNSEVPIEEGGSSWFESQPTLLTTGIHNVSVTLPDGVKLAEMVVHTDARLGDLFDGGSNDVTYSSARISRTEYVVTLQSDKPVFVVLGESYHPEWSAYVGGEELSHFPAFSLSNGFYTNTGGTHTIVIKFDRQQSYMTYVYIGIGVTISSIAIIVYDLLQESSEKSSKRKIKEK